MIIRKGTMRLLALVVFMTGVVCENLDRRDDIVNLPNIGRVKGVEKVTCNHKRYYGFLGLPYAKPPLGNRRFKSPERINPWNGEYDATLRKPQCIRTIRDTIVGSEDCLYINVYTPDITTNKSAPVIVFINGGLWEFNENVDLFIDRGTAFVTINYRDGIFGYLCLDTEEVPGNAALRDVISALRLVKDNIQYFGGDPENLSLMGIGKDALVVDSIRLSSESKGLFQRAILLSSTALSNDDKSLNLSRDNSNFFVKELQDYFVNKNGNMLNQLQELTATQLSVLETKIKLTHQRIPDYLTFSPVVEQKFKGFNPVLSKPPIEHYRSCSYNDMPLIVGYTSKEFLYFHDQLQKVSLLNNDDILPHDWSQSNSNSTAEQIRDFYLTDGINIENLDVLEEAVNLFGDSRLVFPILETLRYVSSCSKYPAYLYRFSFRGLMNDKCIDQYGIQGATHGDEIGYIFPNENLIIPEFSRDNFVRQRLATMFSNFANNSNPIHEYDTRLFGDPWPPVTKETMNYLAVDTNVFVSESPDDRRIQFVSNLINRISK